MEINKKQFDYVKTLTEEFLSENEYATKNFHRYFGHKRAKAKLPVPSLYDLVDRGVCYDEQNRFDLRMLASIIHNDDFSLFIDVAKFVSDQFVNNSKTPVSSLTLMQFKAILTRRLYQVGF